jgi:hypothetical protein
MPWPVYAKMTDEDLRSVFAYLATLEPVRTSSGGAGGVSEVMAGFAVQVPFGRSCRFRVQGSGSNPNLKLRLCLSHTLPHQHGPGREEPLTPVTVPLKLSRNSRALRS